MLGKGVFLKCSPVLRGYSALNNFLQYEVAEHEIVEIKMSPAQTADLFYVIYKDEEDEQ